MSFRFQSKAVLLTYPQIGDLNKGDFVSWIKEQPWSKEVLRYIVALENHEDGGRHIHAVLQWTYRVRTRLSTYFDWAGHHPNISALPGQKNIDRAVCYCRKDGDFVECGNWGPGGWQGAVAAESKEEFFATVLTEHPEAVKSWNGILSFANWRWPDKKVEYEAPEIDFSLDPMLEDWVSTYLNIEGTATAGVRSTRATS